MSYSELSTPTPTPRSPAPQDAFDDEYLLSLGALSLRDIQREPTRLADEQQSLTAQLEELSFSNYRAFLRAHALVTDVRDEFALPTKGHTRIPQKGGFDMHLSKLLDEALPQFNKSCDSFLRSADQCTQRWKREKSLAREVTSCSALVDVPFLMDTCLSAGAYESILTLAESFEPWRSLSRKLAIVGIVAAEVDIGLQRTVSTLVELLETSISLAECLRLMHLLKRLANMISAVSEQDMTAGMQDSDKEKQHSLQQLGTDERALRLVFLRARSAWMLQAMEKESREQRSDGSYSSVTSVRNTIQRFESCLTDIATQYRYVFSPAGPSVGSSEKDQSASSQYYVDPLTLFYAQQYKSLRLLLQKMIGQCFEGEVLRSVSDEVLLAHDVCIRDATLPLVMDQVVLVVESLLSKANAQINAQSLSGVQYAPQRTLADYPVFAVAFNGYVKALNEVRVVPFRKIEPRVRAVFERHLRELAEVIDSLQPAFSNAMYVKRESSHAVDRDSSSWVETHIAAPVRQLLNEVFFG
jgi:hypothetical protein